MTKFNLTDSGYKCKYCLEWVSDNHECDESPERNHMFRHIDDGSEKIITAVSTNDAWEQLEQVVTNPIEWLYFGRVSCSQEKSVEVASDYTRRTGNYFDTS